MFFVQVMKGYYKNPEATAGCLDDDGWLRSGDIGYYDSNGYVYVVDRLKELIKYKGFQVGIFRAKNTVASVMKKR